MDFVVHILKHYIFYFSQADQRKEEGNQLYKTKNYRDALQRYSEAIGNFLNNHQAIFCKNV